MTDLDERHLQQRYGGPSLAQRTVAAVVVAALLVAGAGLLGWAVVAHSNPEVQSQLTAFELPDDHTARATIVVSRSAADTEATCQVRALAEDHSVVGQQTLQVADGPADQSLLVELRTERRATTVELLGCTTPDQPRPR